MKNWKDIYAEIRKCEQYGYFDITYKGKHDWEMLKDTIKFIEIDEEKIKVGFAHCNYVIPLEKVLYVSEPNDICLKYRLRDDYYQVLARLEHFARNDDDLSGSYQSTEAQRKGIFEMLVKLIGSKEKTLAFIEA